MFIGFVNLLYIHYNYQCYYDSNTNCFYSSLWFSIALSTLVHIFFAIINLKKLYYLFIGINIIGLIAGWFINRFYCNWYISRIATRIERKYNQHHVITRLKEEIDMDCYDEEETRSIETISTYIYLIII